MNIRELGLKDRPYPCYWAMWTPVYGSAAASHHLLWPPPITNGVGFVRGGWNCAIASTPFLLDFGHQTSSAQPILLNVLNKISMGVSGELVANAS